MPTDTVDWKKRHPLDVDGDGLITRLEANAERHRDWSRWDRNDDGRIDADEYANAVRVRPAKGG